MTSAAATERRRSAVGSRDFLPEVQALRAVAVLLVVVYHLWPGRLQGGYIGVDVFFVISGFLITLHLLKGLLGGERVPLLRFWANRIWRLIPASLLVLLVCWVFTLLVTPVTTASNALKQIGAAAAYVLNWVLASDSVDYLARDNVPTIVQHYWSLSVEEQFYLLWPLLLTGVVLVASFVTQQLGKKASRESRGTALLVIVLLITGVSLAYSVFVTHYFPSRAYFDTFARAWEFSAGGLLAITITRYPAAIAVFRGHRSVQRWALPQLVGFGLILGAGVWMSDTTPFPSGWAAVPVLGAVLIMLGGAPRAGWFTDVVSWRPAQFTGDLSYSLYLWHWPLIVGFAIVVGRRHSFLEGLLLLVAGFALAWLTKITVEDPIRKWGRTKRLRPAFLLAAVSASVLVLASSMVVSARSAEAASIAEEQLTHISDQSACVGAHATLGPSACEDPFALSPGANPVRAEKDLNPGWCLTWFDQDWLSCEFGDLAAINGTVAIVGDSHAAALTNPLGDYLESRGWKLVTFTRFGCPGLSQSPIGLRAQTSEVEQACADWSQRVLNELKVREDIDTVIFTSFESAYAQPESPGAAQLTSRSVENTLAGVAATGKEVVLLRDFAATGGVDIPTCVASSRDVENNCSVSLAVGFPPGPFDPAIEDLTSQIRIIDLQEATCDAQRCYGLVGDVIVYADDNHVSETFATSLMSYLGPALIDGAKLSSAAGP